MFQEKIITWETTLDNYYPEMIQIKIITEHSFNNILILSVYINFFFIFILHTNNELQYLIKTTLHRYYDVVLSMDGILYLSCIFIHTLV